MRKLISALLCISIVSFFCFSSGILISFVHYLRSFSGIPAAVFLLILLATSKYQKKLLLLGIFFLGTLFPKY